MGFFGRRKTQGRVFGAEKKPLREWGHAIPRFSIETDLFSRRKTQGHVFWGRKKPLREWGHAIPRFSIETGLFSRRKTQGRVFGAEKSPCGKHADSHPGFGQGPVSNLILMGLSRPWLKEWPSTHHHNSKSHTLGFEPGASGVRRPCARPLGNLTTVGHLATHISLGWYVNGSAGCHLSRAANLAHGDLRPAFSDT